MWKSSRHSSLRAKRRSHNKSNAAEAQGAIQTALMSVISWPRSRFSLTMVRRKSVSPISALIQDERRIKGKHEFFIIGASGSEQAEIPRPNPAVDAPPSLQSADRGSLYRLDSGLYSF